MAVSPTNEKSVQLSGGGGRIRTWGRIKRMYMVLNANVKREIKNKSGLMIWKHFGPVWLLIYGSAWLVRCRKGLFGCLYVDLGQVELMQDSSIVQTP